MIGRAFPNGATRADLASFLRAGDLLLGWGDWVATANSADFVGWSNPRVVRHGTFYDPRQWRSEISVASETGRLHFKCREGSQAIRITWFPEGWYDSSQISKYAVSVTATIVDGPGSDITLGSDWNLWRGWGDLV